MKHTVLTIPASATAPTGHLPYFLTEAALAPVEERIADRIAVEVPTLAAKIDRTQTAAIMRESIAACRRAELPPLTTRAIAVLAEIAVMRAENQDENYDRFLSYLANLIWHAGDSKAVLAEVAALISRVRTEAAL
ncbi:hypothetical protein OG373_06685 [Streptomyces avidinii]|uniref:hypothetical protein n=1 Tax=Streptomyces avidinii TaxID=1895 RepID=UPI0038643DC6|nr:hypothetical protein OG373_06685 [Streptomyces avidinii]